MQKTKSLKKQIEALLYISSRPLGVEKLSEMTGTKIEEIETIIEELNLDYKERGVRIIRSGNEIQVSTAPECHKLIRDFVREELTSELTKPQLETLTIISYRSPISRTEIEQVRGVNCAIILRNLLIRGLIISDEDPETKRIVYRPSIDFLRLLGISKVDELPNYAKLSRDKRLEDLLSEVEDE